jgi:hypothetical protein
MSSFPIYDTLSENASQKDLNAKQKDEFMDKIKTLDQQGYELVYALIRAFQMENNDDKTTFKLPYKGKIIKTETGEPRLDFDLEKLPNKLKQILYKFVNIHIKSMLENNNFHPEE